MRSRYKRDQCKKEDLVGKPLMWNSGNISQMHHKLTLSTGLSCYWFPPSHQGFILLSLRSRSISNCLWSTRSRKAFRSIYLEGNEKDTRQQDPVRGYASPALSCPPRWAAPLGQQDCCVTANAEGHSWCPVTDHPGLPVTSKPLTSGLTKMFLVQIRMK